MLLSDWLVGAHDNWSATAAVSCCPAFLRREELGRLWQLGKHYNFKFTGKQRNSTKQTTIQISLSSAHIALHGLLWIFYPFVIGWKRNWGSVLDTVSYEALFNLLWTGNITRTLKLANIVMLELLSFSLAGIYTSTLRITIWGPSLLWTETYLNSHFLFSIIFNEMIIFMWNYVSLVLKKAS